LLQFEPSFYSAIPQSASLATSLDAEVDRLAASVRELITQANEHYSALHGKDLFKPTNKTVNALTTELSKVAKDYEGYKALVENLYFIFRESLGNRLEGHPPASFVDVNHLRTLNEHDIDHGKASKVAKQKKELGAVFEKFAGEKTPSTIDPSKFVIIQTNILAALEHDLRILLKAGFGA
jgi:hypothetical protein